MTIAQTILKQLGGNKFLIMTGCKDFVDAGYTLRFKLARAVNGISHVRVTLDIDDCYRVEFVKWSAKRLAFTIVAAYGTVYADQLCTVFEKETGLATRL